MKRPLTVVAASLAALSFVVLPASAGHAPPARLVQGSVTSLTQTAVVVTDAHGASVTCALGAHSPSTSAFSVGDRVAMLCVRSRHELVLARLKHLTAPGPTNGSADSAPATFGGAITSLTATQISLHDGNRDFTCTIGSSSPATTGYSVGQHVKVACVGGALVAIAPIGPGDLGRYFVGTVSDVGDTSLTIQTEHGAVTCTIGAGSPSVAALHVGDKIGMGCNASTMQLVLLRQPSGDAGTGGSSGGGSGSGDGGSTSTPPPPAPTPHTTGGQGPIATLTDGSISVTTDGGTVTCTIGPSSPDTSGFEVGDQVRIACVDGALHEIAAVGGGL